MHYEITKNANDPDGKIAAALHRLQNQVQIIPTVTEAGFKALREVDPNYPSKNLGEQAVDEYARRIARLQMRKTAMIPFERGVRTRKVKSNWLRRSFTNEQD